MGKTQRCSNYTVQLSEPNFMLLGTKLPTIVMALGEKYLPYWDNSYSKLLI